MRRVTSRSLPPIFAQVRRGSFAGAAFRGKLVTDEVFPFRAKSLNEEVADDHQSLLKDLREATQASKDGGSAQPLKGTGIHGIAIETEFGGLNLNALARTSAAEFCASTLPNASTFSRSVQEHAALVKSVVAQASPELKGRFLPGMSDGSMVVAWAADEVAAFPDASMTQATAVLENDQYTVNGVKNTRFDCSGATHLLVMAKCKTQTIVDDKPVLVDRLSFYMVDSNAEGVSVDGRTVTLKDVKVPADCLVGTAGGGYGHYITSFLSCQPIAAAAVLGTLRRLFSQKLFMPSLPAETAALLRSLVFALENVVATTAANQDLDVEDSTIEICAMVMLAHRVVRFVNTEVGTDMLHPGAVSTVLDELNTVCSTLLPLNFVRMIAASCGVEDFGVNFIKTSTLDVMQQRTTRSLGFIDKMPPMKECSEVSGKIEKLCLKLSEATEKTFVKNGPSTKNRQLLLHRLAEANALLYSAVCCVSRAQLVAGSKAEVAQARIFAEFAIAEAEELCEECLNVGECADEAYGRLASEVMDQYVTGA